jgi:integrase
VRRVKEFASYLKRSPDTAKPEDVRGFQLHLTSSGAGTPKINATVAALRFFFRVTLDRPELSRHLATIHEPRKAPVILGPDEMERFLEAAPGIKYKAALSVGYGAGLRVSEIAFLKVTDIDSQRMMLRIEQGKGRKDRYVMLSPTLLELLRDWYRVARPQGWLFPGQNPTNPITTRQLTRAWKFTDRQLVHRHAVFVNEAKVSGVERENTMADVRKREITRQQCEINRDPPRRVRRVVLRSIEYRPDRSIPRPGAVPARDKRVRVLRGGSCA